MRTKSALLSTIAASSLLFGAAVAGAQQPAPTDPAGTQQPLQEPAQQIDQLPADPAGTAPTQPQVAEQCLENLQGFAMQMQQDGYWLTGWGTRWGAGPEAGPPVTEPVPEGAAPGAAPGEGVATDPLGPWGTGNRWGAMSPRHQISTLYSAAHVLAHRGEQQGCDVVVSELQELYGAYVAELQEAGVEPGEVTTWRQEQLVAAQPVEEVHAGVINLADVTGTEVRNAQDEYLGSIDDVIIDAQDGGIRYVVITTGGFLGIGQDYVAVPWAALSVTPGLQTFVLPITGDILDEAPRIDPEVFADPTQAAQAREQVDYYWQNHTSG